MYDLNGKEPIRCTRIDKKNEMKKQESIIEQVKSGRLSKNLWKLVNIPSPTRQERNASLAFAEMLSEAGAHVKLDESLPDSPSVIGRLQGNRPGKTIQLAGHIDHIDKSHPKPTRNDKSMSGRGAADMKNGLAGILEVVSVLNENGCDFPGEVLVTSYGLHESPLGDHRGLLNLIKRGIKGDAAIVAEGVKDRAIVMGKGQSIWNIQINRNGEICHELRLPPNTGDILGTAQSVISSLMNRNDEFKNLSHSYPLLGPESLFIGQVHYGDFYNRVPKECRLQGTRRWHPNKTFDDVKEELKDILNRIQCPAGVSIESDWNFVGEAYQINVHEPVVQALISACKEITGKDPAVDGISLVTDANDLVRRGGVPSVLCGFGGEGAHGDYECVAIADMEVASRIVISSVLTYLNSFNKNQ